MARARHHFASSDSAMDTIFSDMPTHPYLLKPNDDAKVLRANRSGIIEWEHSRSPFDEKELGHGLEYLTFLRDPASRQITRTEGGWEDGLAPQPINPQAIVMDSSKKRTKISLSDYSRGAKKPVENTKMGQDGLAAGSRDIAQHGQKSSTSDIPIPGLPIEDKLAVIRHNEPHVEYNQNQSDISERKESTDASKLAQQERQRLLEEKESRQALKTFLQQTKQQTAAVAAEVEAKAQTASRPQPPSKPQTSKVLPPMLSPLRGIMSREGAQDIGAQRYVLPPLLSPLLPEPVEEALRALHDSENRQKTRSAESRIQNKIRPASIQSTSKAGTSSSATSRDQGKRRDVTSANKQNLPAVKSHAEKQSYIIKLRYGKRNTKQVINLLKLKSTPASTACTVSDKRAVSTSDQKKRERDDAEDMPFSSQKRTKLPPSGDLTVPSSKIQIKAPKQSPVFPPSPAALTDTPKRGIAMVRVSSTDQIATSPEGMMKMGTPATASKTSVPAAFSSTKKSHRLTWPASIVLQPEFILSAMPEGHEQLSAEYTSYNQLGTQLKRSMDGVLQVKQKPQQPLSPRELKLGTLIGMESVCAYMLAFSRYERLRQVEKKSPMHACEHWESLLRLTPFIIDKSKAYPDLQWAALLCVAVVRERLYKNQIDTMSEITRAAAAGQELRPVDKKLFDGINNNTCQRAEAWYAVSVAAVAAMPGIKTEMHNSSVADVVGIALMQISAFARNHDSKWVRAIPCRKEAEGDARRKAS